LRDSAAARTRRHAATATILPASIERRVEKDAKATRAEEKRAIVAAAARTTTVSGVARRIAPSLSFRWRREFAKADQACELPTHRLPSDRSTSVIGSSPEAPSTPADFGNAPGSDIGRPPRHIFVIPWPSQLD